MARVGDVALRGPPWDSPRDPPFGKSTDKESRQMVTMSSFGKFHRGSSSELFREIRTIHASLLHSRIAVRIPDKPTKIDPFSAYPAPADRADTAVCVAACMQLWYSYSAQVEGMGGVVLRWGVFGRFGGVTTGYFMVFRFGFPVSPL